MADEVVEPQEIVPEQGEFFASEAKQTVGEMLEQAPPEAAPAPEPAPAEPEPPPVEPDWLSAPAEPQPEQAPPQQQQYYEPPPQYLQQPQAPPATGADAALNRLMDNPDGWADGRIDQRLAQQVGPLAQQQQQVNFMMNTLMENNINDGVTRADGSIRNAYESFNKDATFRSNKVMQDKIGATLQGMRERATSEARRGNFGPLNALANLSESDIAGTLAYVRAATGVQSPGVGPLQVEGAAVESSRSAVVDSGVSLTAEQEEIAKRMGPGYRDRMIEGIKDQQKYDDLEISE